MMTILKDVFAELLSMFITDARLTLTTLALVGLVALLLTSFNLQPIIAGAVLLCGCIVIVFEATFRETQKRMR
jgi:hypothetical protein